MAMAICPGLFFIFKLAYPYPNLIMDSYVYIRPMVLHHGANSFPIGYSWFLEIFSFFSRSTTLLVWIQFVVLLIACLLLYFTVLYFFRLGKKAKVILFTILFFVMDPIFFYSSNLIMSDTIFTALSVLWITQLIWLIGRPKTIMILTHALLLLFVFTVRYNALYYPVLASLALLFAPLSLWQKTVAVFLQVLFIAAFIQFTSRKMEKMTGVRQFSPFGGWKMANNALYMYGHVCQSHKDSIPYQFARIDDFTRQYFTTVRRVDNLSSPFSDGGFYMSNEESPLSQYQFQRFGRDSVFQDFRKWGPMGPVCADYGGYLIKRYPVEFFRWFIWPNATRYFAAPLEVFSLLSPYYLRDDDLGLMASRWFSLKTLTVSSGLIKLRTTLMAPYPIISGLMHLAFMSGLLGFFIFGGFKKLSRRNAYIVGTAAAFWFFDLFFKLTAGAIVLRHQLFLMILELVFAAVFIDFIYGKADNDPHPLDRKVLYTDVP